MAQKPGLGRGLNALIPSGAPVEPKTGVTMVPVGSIRANELQPRQDFNVESLNELAASIREFGIIQPLVVTSVPGTGEYHLIAGERRLRAAKLAGLSEVPVIERTLGTDESKLLLALIENIQRSDLAPLETAEAYQQLADAFSMSHEQIALKVGKSRASVSNTLRLLNLMEPVKDALRKDLISEGHGRAILGLSSASAQPAVLQTVIARNLSVRETEELVKRFNAEKPAAAKVHLPEDPMVKSIEKQLQSKLSTRVSLNHRKKGGTITIYYYSDEELNQILAELLE